MQSTKTRVVKYLRSYPNFKIFLNVLIKKQGDKMIKEIQNREKMVEKAKTSFKYDTAN